jgi:HSP20 family molecular chaperone IbpA
MFGKKINCKCGKKIDSKYEFCPHCGTPLKESITREKQFDDQFDNLTKQLSQEFGMPFLAGFPFKGMIKNLAKDMEKQLRGMDSEMHSMDQEIERFDPNNMRIDDDLGKTGKKSKNAKESNKPIMKDGQKIGNMKEVNFPGGYGFTIQINMGGKDKMAGDDEKNEKSIKLPSNKMTEEEIEKFSKLPRKEPETRVRRLTDKIIYEIKLPGVKTEKDIAINKLQNSIEIKAFAKDRTYFKLIPLSFPIKKYNLKDGTLTLELKP